MTKPQKDIFCPAPWHVLRIRNIGAYGPCCHFISDRTIDHNAKFMSIQEYRNSHEQHQLRQTILSGQEHPRCQHCYKEEREKKVSLRQKLNSTYTDWDRDYSAEQPLDLKEMQIELGNLCNFKCVTCLPELSTQVASDWKKLNWLEKSSRPNFLVSDFGDLDTGLHIKFYTDQDYIKNFNDNIGELDSVRILGGEPLINPALATYLDLFDEEHASKVQILIATNCSVWQPDVLEKFTKFGKIKINLSIDATGDLFEYIRYNGKWDSVFDNMKKFLSFSSRIVYTVVITVSVYNILSLDEIINDLTKSFPQTKIVLNPVYEPLFLDASIMPEELKNIFYSKTLSIDNNYQHKIWLRMEWSSMIRRLKEVTFDSVKWQQFVTYTQQLESIRNNSISRIVPQFEPYL